MKPPRVLHPLDRLVREVQRSGPSRKLDLKIARALYGRDVLYCAKTKRYLVVRLTRASYHELEIAHYTATRQQVERACQLLRKRKRELTAVEPLRMAA